MSKNINLNFNNQALININKNKRTFNEKYVIVSTNKFLNKDNPQITCNCRKSNRPNCPLRLIINAVYKIESKVRNRVFIGSTGNSFKDR